MDKKYQKLEWTDQMISDFWDFKAEFYQGQYFANMVGEYIIKDLEKYFPNAKNVLDWGSGPGFLIKHLLARKLDVYALDFSPSSISMVNEKYGQDAKFKGAFLPEDLKKQNLKFDLIILVEVVEHLSDDYLDQTFSQIKELLSDDGVCVITTPNDEDLIPSVVVCPNCLKYFHRVQHMRSWSQESLSEYARKSGFKVVDAFTTAFYFRPETVRRGWGQRVDEFISHRIINKIFKKDKDGEQPAKQPHLVCIIKK